MYNLNWVGVQRDPELLTNASHVACRDGRFILSGSDDNTARAFEVL
jgi:hypothetical protein